MGGVNPVRVRCPKCGEAVDLGGLSVGICDCGAKVRLPERPPPVPTSEKRKERPVPEEIPAGELEAALSAGELPRSEWTAASVGRVGRGIAAGLATLFLGTLSVLFCGGALADQVAMDQAVDRGMIARHPALWVIAALLCWILISLGWLRDVVRRAIRDR